MTAPTDSIPANNAAVTRDETPAAASGQNDSWVAWLGLSLAAMAFLASVFAVAIALRAVDRAENAPAAAAGAPLVATMRLSDFALTPASITVGRGGSLEVVNDGPTAHDVAVEGNATPIINQGESATLDVSSLEPGTYTIVCDVPGHKELGMTGTLTIV